MSSSNELENKDEKRSRYYINEKGHRIHEDANGQEWFMKAPTGGYEMGFENVFYNSILDHKFKDAVYQKIYAAKGTKETLQIDGEYFNIFINQDNLDSTSISRKSTKKFEDVTEEPIEVKDVPKYSSSSGSGGGTGQKRDRSIVDRWKYHKQPLALAEEDLVLEKFWVIEKGVPPIIVQDGSEKYILTRLNHITFNY